VPTEVFYLAWSVVLLLAHVFLQGGLAAREVGLVYNAGARDEGRRPRGLFALRAERAARNFLETYPAFVGLALALVVTGGHGGLGATGAALWFWSRLAYLPLYVSGVPWVRSFAWFGSLFGLLLMLIRLLS